MSHVLHLKLFRLHSRGLSDDMTHLQIEGFDHFGIFHPFCSSHSTGIQGMTWLVQDWPSPAKQPQASVAGHPGHNQTPSSLPNFSGASSIPPAPPPPPPPPAAPPPSTEVPTARPEVSASRGALLSSIQNFQKGTLKKTQTCDYSAPRISWGHWSLQDSIPSPPPVLTVLTSNRPTSRERLQLPPPRFQLSWVAALPCPALPELLCRAGISTLGFTWLQQLCSLATVSGLQQLLYSWIKKKKKSENRNDHDDGEWMHFS